MQLMDRLKSRRRMTEERLEELEACKKRKIKYKYNEISVSGQDGLSPYSLSLPLITTENSGENTKKQPPEISEKKI